MLLQIWGLIDFFARSVLLVLMTFFPYCLFYPYLITVIRYRKCLDKNDVFFCSIGHDWWWYFLQPLVYWTKVTLFMLPFMHAIFNPVVYFIMSRSFRQSATNKFRQCTSHTEKRLCCKNNSEKGTNEDDLKLETIPLTT